jgi:GT2 family glycosyltransferase
MIKFSFLLVTKNRPKELWFTLEKLHFFKNSETEILVYVDGCEKTKTIVSDFPWVNWYFGENSFGASPARAFLYKMAKGKYFIGLDDDAHPVSSSFLEKIENHFLLNEMLGIIAFQEIKGMFNSDLEVLQKAKKQNKYSTNDFIGSGFAISNVAYNATNGFPIWMDIYGEETALSLEVLNKDYSILFIPEIIVNHRIDVEKRKAAGRNYFRFEKQLKNTLNFYVVYHPKPFVPIAKAIFHNFKKYAFINTTYFKCFCRAVFSFLLGLSKVIKFRNIIPLEIWKLRQSLQSIPY